MDFWNVYEAQKAKQGFGTSRLRVASRDRIHVSLSTVERYSMLLGMNQGMSKKFTEEARYIITKNLTHDLFISIYDVNTTSSALLRFSEALGDAAVSKLAGRLRKLKKPNLEMRIIGMQNGDSELLSAADRLYAATKPALIEADLFGNETRQIAFDLKLGMPFDLLLLNRIYRPHELANAQSIDDYNKSKSDLKFV